MQKRMVMVSRKVHEALGPAGSKKSAAASRMHDHLYQAQCNDSYWHGVFGGLYLPHLRSAVYEHLIQAEFLADKVLKNGSKGQGARGRGKKQRQLHRHRGSRSNRETLIRTGTRK